MKEALLTDNQGPEFETQIFTQNQDNLENGPKPKKPRKRVAILRGHIPARLEQKEIEPPIREDEEIFFSNVVHISERRIGYGTAMPDNVKLLINDMERFPVFIPSQEKYAFKCLKDGKTLQDLKNDSYFISLFGPRSEEKVMSALDESKDLKEFLANCNMRLVLSIAKHFQNRGLQYEDLIQNGVMGLMRAIDKFDPDKPQKDDPTKTHKFSTYATWWIKQSIIRELINTATTIRIPVHVNEGITKASKIAEAFFSENNRNPKAWELRELMMKDPDTKRTDADLVIRALQGFTSGRLASLDLDIGNGKKEFTLGDLVPDGASNIEEGVVERVGRQELRGALLSAMQQLPEREREILIMRFGIDDGKEKSLEAIAHRFNLTRERIRQIEGRALRLLQSDQALKNSFKIEDEAVVLDKPNKDASIPERSVINIPETREEPIKKMDVVKLIDLASEYIDVWDMFDPQAKSILKLYYRSSDKQDAKAKIEKIFKMSEEDFETFLDNCRVAIALRMQTS